MSNAHVISLKMAENDIDLYAEDIDQDFAQVINKIQLNSMLQQLLTNCSKIVILNRFPKSANIRRKILFVG